MKPVISVIIPAYNEEKLIARCIKALLMQDFSIEKFEIIVVDNNSTDRTLEIAKQFNVRVLEYTKMNRVGAVRQYGADKSNGNILAFMDADSYPHSSWLSSIEKVMSNNDIVAICGVALPISKSIYIRFGFYVFNQLSRINQLFGIVLPWGFNFAIKKSAFDKLGGYDLLLETYDDAEIGLRIQKVFGKKRIIYSQELKVYTSTRKHENFKILGGYVMDTIKNYVNVVILKRKVSAKIRNVR